MKVDSMQVWQDARPLDALVRYRLLTKELVKREILGRYRGATFGLMWSLMSPFLMLMVYTLAFGYILKGRWPGTSGSTLDFTLILFVGLIVHGFFAECLTRSPQLILSNANYVKRVLFPLQILPWSMALAALFHLAMNVVVLLLMKALLHQQVYATTFLLPIVLLPLFVLTIGTSWMVAALGVYLRDIGQVVGVLATAMLFLSSAIVPVEALPENFRWVFYANPLTFIIDQARNVVIWGKGPDWIVWTAYLASAVVFSLLSFTLFQKLRKGFADVL